MARWRIALGIAIVAALAVTGAIVVGSALRDEPEVVTSEPIAAPSSPLPTPTVDDDPMPELHNTGDDFDQIYRSIEDFRNWLFRNPDPDLVDRIYHPDCECLEETRRRLQLLVDEGLRFASNGTVIREISVLDQNEAAVALKVSKQQLRQTVIREAGGALVDEDPGSGVESFRFLLLRENQAWLVRDIAEVPHDLEVVSTPQSDNA